jgi:hypothetical protein
MSDRNEKIVDSYEGAEGDVLACGTGLKWVAEGKARKLAARLQQKGGESAPRVLAFLEEVRKGQCEHGEVARRIGCQPRQLRRAFAEMTKVIRHEFRGHGWPFGYQVVGRKYIYEMHPEVAVAFGHGAAP